MYVLFLNWIIYATTIFRPSGWSFCGLFDLIPEDSVRFQAIPFGRGLSRPLSDGYVGLGHFRTISVGSPWFRTIVVRSRTVPLVIGPHLRSKSFWIITFLKYSQNISRSKLRLYIRQSLKEFFLRIRITSAFSRSNCSFVPLTVCYSFLHDPARLEFLTPLCSILFWYCYEKLLNISYFREGKGNDICLLYNWGLGLKTLVWFLFSREPSQVLSVHRRLLLELGKHYIQRNWQSQRAL